MRILMLAQFYSPIMGGEERHVKSLCDELVARGHSVAVATIWHPGLAEYEEDGGVRIYRLDSSVQRVRFIYKHGDRFHAPPFPDAETLIGLKRVIEKEAPEIIHAHNWLVYSYLPLKKWTKAPLVVTLHDYSLACPKKRLMYQYEPCSGPALVKCARCTTDHYGPLKGVPTMLANRLMGSIERSAVDMYIAVSQSIAQGNQLVGQNTPYEVIPNFVPAGPEEGDPATHPLVDQLPEAGFLLFVGDLTRDKGIHVLLKAYEQLGEAPPLVLIGRPFGDTPQELPPNVQIFYSWPHDAIMQAWCRSLIALAPSIWPEPFGIVVLEAMSAGRPVIATRMGGLTDIVVHGQTGLLVPPHDPAALEQAIRKLLENPELRRQMGRAGKIRVKQFSTSQVVPRIEAMYRRLLGCDNPVFLADGDAGVEGSPLAKISGGDRGVTTR